MATPARRLDVSSSDIEDDAASSTSVDPQDQANRTGPSGTTLPTTNSTQSVEAYVRNILRQYPHDDRDRADDQLNEIRIERRSDDPSKYENVSAFRQYNSDEQLDRRRVGPQSRPTTIDEEVRPTCCFFTLSSLHSLRILARRFRCICGRIEFRSESIG